MSHHLLGVLEPSVILQVNRDASRPAGVTSDRHEKTRRLGPLSYCSPGVVPIKGSSGHSWRGSNPFLANDTDHSFRLLILSLNLLMFSMPVEVSDGEQQSFPQVLPRARRREMHQ
jgi:hypothetical protein